MSSLLRRLRKRAPVNARRAKGAKRRAELAEFELQRRFLFDKLLANAADCGEPDPVKFLAFLKQQRRGYDPKHDGASQLMQLVDDIEALDALEKEWADASAKPVEAG